MTNSPAADIILQIMAYDNANEDCKRAVGTQRGKTDAMGYLWLCQGVGTEQPRNLAGQTETRLVSTDSRRKSR